MLMEEHPLGAGRFCPADVSGGVADLAHPGFRSCSDRETYHGEPLVDHQHPP